MENYLKGIKNYFELARGSSYRGFELLGVDCVWLPNKRSNTLFTLDRTVIGL